MWILVYHSNLLVWKFGLTFHTTKIVSTLQLFPLFRLHINIDSFLKFNVTLNVTLLHQNNTYNNTEKKTRAYYDLNRLVITITIVNLWPVVTNENDKNSCEIFFKLFRLLPTDCSTLQTASEIKCFRNMHANWNCTPVLKLACSMTVASNQIFSNFHAP